MTEQVELCLICKSSLSLSNKTDVKLTLTQKSQVNLEEFIKETVLILAGDAIFASNYICNQCHIALNEFDSYNIKCKEIQSRLLQQFLSEELLIKQELLQVVCESNLMHNDEKPSESKDFNFMLPPRSTKPESNDKSQAKKSCKDAQVKKASKGHVATDNKVSQANSGMYCCEICGKQYEKANGFRIHRRMHKNLNILKCEICNKSFTQKIGLKRHMRKHTGEALYECDICKKKFIHQTSYTMHKMRHEGTRNHQCEICGLALISKSHLTRHKRTHTSEKKFGCAECGRLFAERYNLVAHEKKVHLKIDAKPMIETNPDSQIV